MNPRDTNGRVSPNNKTKNNTGVNMADKTESERLYVVETKLDTVLDAVEKTNGKIDILSESLASYATRSELEAAVIERNNEIASLREADKLLARKHALNVWITGVSASAFGAGLTVLIQMAIRG